MASKPSKKGASESEKAPVVPAPASARTSSAPPPKSSSVPPAAPGSVPPAKPGSIPPSIPPRASDPGAKKKAVSAADIAAELVAGIAEPPLIYYARALEDDNAHSAAQAARVFEELIAQKPELCAPHIERLVRGLSSMHPRVIQAAAAALPVLARVAPAKVARHLDKLLGGFAASSEVAKDGMVRTFVALCVASVAYQRRVIDVLELALSGAEAKTLQRWTELVLPALKGEPHAQARAAVEKRLQDIARPQAEKIAEFLGIRLRRVQ
jgi:hypothetical protein